MHLAILLVVVVVVLLIDSCSAKKWSTLYNNIYCTYKPVECYYCIYTRIYTCDGVTENQPCEYIQIITENYTFANIFSCECRNPFL